MKHTSRILRTIVAGLVLLSAMAVNSIAAPQNPTDKFKNLEFREIGPAVMGGRIDDFAVVESNTNIVYAATASGGLFKTLNNLLSQLDILLIFIRCDVVCHDGKPLSVIC